MQHQVRKSIPKAKWLNILDNCNYRCYYCNHKTSLIREHFIPLSRGGSSGIENIVASCIRCNMQKGTSTGPEYLKWMSFLYFAGMGPKPIKFCTECGKSLVSRVMHCIC
jgi:5-methylcytosine-specific restriction endonuclease McrA